MSLFAKLSASTSGAPSPLVSTVAHSGTWTASLQRHENGPHQVLVTGSCPLSQEQLNRGCVCLATVGIKKFLVYLTAACVRPAQTPTPFGLSLSAKLFEHLQLNPKDAKEISLDDLSSQGPKDQNPNITSNALTELVISIKDRYVSKRELWKFQIRLLGSVVYKSLPPPNDDLLRCSAAVVEDMSPPTVAGIVGPQTKIIVRSNSAQLFLIINITKELWDFDPVTHEPLFRKTVQLVREGLDQCALDSKHHHVLLMLAVRMDTPSPDVYEILAEGPVSSLDAKNIEKQMIDFFNNFPNRIGWIENPFYTETIAGEFPDWLSPISPNTNVSVVRDSALCACTHDEERTVPGFPGTASSSCVLESINLAISHFGKHHMDRKLGVTGTQITVITANSGLFVIDDQNLLAVTRRRVQATACGIRIVSVGRRPTVATFHPVCKIGTSVHPIDWLVFYFFNGNSPVLRDSDGMDSLAALLLPMELSPYHQASQFRPVGLSGELSSGSRKIVPEPFKSSLPRKPARTDEEIVQLALAKPRLQRVAVEATIRPGDVKPIDNWIVQGEGVKTLHDLIGTRLSLDMQLVDISGTEGGSLTPPVVPSNTSGSLTPRSEKAASSSMISANAFGVKVHRSSMREFHIQKVLLRGAEDRCLWMLNRLDSGNVYVSRVALANQAKQTIDFESDSASVSYKYILRRSRVTPTGNPDISEVIACKSCLGISDSSCVETRRFFVPPPIPWNVLDEIISNPYFQRTLPSSVPLNLAPVPPELEGFRWKLRSSIRTGLFCLIPRDEGFAHQFSPGSVSSLGSDVTLTAGVSNVSASNVASRFLDWLRKTENLLGLESLNISVLGDKQKRSGKSGFVPHLVTADGGLDWFHFHAEPSFQFPKLFVFSIEWILCHSAIIDNVISSLERFAKEDMFSLVRLPHAQLFPLPAPGGEEDSTDPLPFHPRTVIKLPEWTKPSFFPLLLSRLMDQLGLLLLLANKDPGSPEGFFVGPGRGASYYSRQPGWILVNKTGSVLVEIGSVSVDWIDNCTNSWVVGRPPVEPKTFLLFKQAIHTSLIDSLRQYDQP